MTKIEEQIAKFKKIDVWETIGFVIFQNKDFLLELVKDQLRKGQTKTGKTETYSNSQWVQEYLDYKVAFNKILQSTLPYMNLYDEGNFYEGMDIAIKANLIEIFSRDGKAAELESLYGSEIYELSEESMEELKTFILPRMMKLIREQLGY